MLENSLLLNKPKQKLKIKIKKKAVNYVTSRGCLFSNIAMNVTQRNND